MAKTKKEIEDIIKSLGYSKFHIKADDKKFSIVIEHMGSEIDFETLEKISNALGTKHINLHSVHEEGSYHEEYYYGGDAYIDIEIWSE